MHPVRRLLTAITVALSLTARAQGAPQQDPVAEGRRRIETALKLRTPEAALRAQLVSLGIADPQLADGLNFYRKELARLERLEALKSVIRPGNAPVRGGAAAPVTIIEVSDFECPYCARVQPTLLQLEREYPGKLRTAFKFYPLPSHNYARPAAAAARAAQRQGRFWEMHDYLFAHQAELEKLAGAGFSAAAAALSLDGARFSADYRSLLNDQSGVDADIAETQKWLVEATPTFFINGQMLAGAKPIAEFKKIIDEALAAKPAPGKPGGKPGKAQPKA